MATKSERMQPTQEVQRNRLPDGSLEEWYPVERTENAALVAGTVLLRVDTEVLARLFIEGVEPRLLGAMARWEVVRKGCPYGTGFEGYAVGLQSEEMPEVIRLIGETLYWRLNPAQAGRTGSKQWQKHFATCERKIRALTVTLKSRRLLSTHEAQQAERVFEVLVREFRAWEQNRARRNPELSHQLTQFRGQTQSLTLAGYIPSVVTALDGSQIGLHWPKNPENAHSGVAPFPALPLELKSYQYLMEFLQEIGRMGAPLTRKLLQLSQEQWAQSPWLKTKAVDPTGTRNGNR